MKIQLPNYTKAAIIIIGLFVFFNILFILSSILIPIIYSIIIAILLSPIVDFIVRRRIHKIIAITVTLLLVMAIVSTIVALLSTQLLQFSDSLPLLTKKFDLLFSQSVSWISDTFHIGEVNINSWIDEKNTELLTKSNAAIGRTIVITGNFLVIIVLIPVYTFMFLYYQPLILEFIHRVFQIRSQTKVNEVLSETKKIIHSYLVGLLIEALIVATLNITALLILGIDYAILIGVIGAVLNVIPYLGGLISVSLAMLVALLTSDSPSYCLLVLGAYIIIQFVDNNFIIPKVVASKVKVNALVSIVVVIAGGALWGIPGMFLSIPLTAILKVIFDHIESLSPYGYLIGDTMPISSAKR